MPDAATPRDVLEVFLKSFVIGDCAVTRELSTPSGFMQVGGFCDRIHVIDFEILGDGSASGPDAITFGTRLTIDRGTDVLRALVKLSGNRPSPVTMESGH